MFNNHATWPVFSEAWTRTEFDRAVINSPGVLNEGDLKTRIVAVNSYAIGTAPGSRAVVYAQLRMLSSRSPWTRFSMSDCIAAVLRRLTPRLDGMLVQLSIEMAEMDRGSYTRERLGGVVGW